MEKRKQTLAMSQESFLERISLPNTVLALIGLADTITLYLEYIQNHVFFFNQVLKFFQVSMSDEYFINQKCLPRVFERSYFWICGQKIF